MDDGHWTVETNLPSQGRPPLMRMSPASQHRPCSSRGCPEPADPSTGWYCSNDCRVANALLDGLDGGRSVVLYGYTIGGVVERIRYLTERREGLPAD